MAVKLFTRKCKGKDILYVEYKESEEVTQSRGYKAKCIICIQEHYTTNRA